MNSTEQRNPFAPAPLQSLHHYYGLLRACSPLWYSRPRSWSRLWTRQAACLHSRKLLSRSVVMEEFRSRIAAVARTRPSDLVVDDGDVVVVVASGVVEHKAHVRLLTHADRRIEDGRGIDPAVLDASCVLADLVCAKALGRRRLPDGNERRSCLPGPNARAEIADPARLRCDRSDSVHHHAPALRRVSRVDGLSPLRRACARHVRRLRQDRLPALSSCSIPIAIRDSERSRAPSNRQNRAAPDYAPRTFL